MKNRLIILFLLISPLLKAQEVWHISWLNPSPVQIEGRPMHEGDEFAESASILWGTEDQVMKVLGKSSRRCLVLSAKAIYPQKGSGIRDYIDVCQRLSTRNAAYREQAEEGVAFHFIGYEKDGCMKTLIPREDLFLDEMPEEIWLCYANTGTGEQRVETRNFRALVDELIITDALVRRLMDQMGYDEDSYLSLMFQFMEPSHKDIPLTIEEINIYLTIKY